MDYVKWGSLGAAALLVSDMAGSTSTVKNMSPGAQKLVRIAVAGLTVALTHKYLLKAL